MKASFNLTSDRETVLISIFFNVITWSTYAGIECIIEYSTCFFGQPHNRTVLHGGFIATLTVFYSFIGLCIGCAFGTGFAVVNKFSKILRGKIKGQKSVSILSSLSTFFLIGVFTLFCLVNNYGGVSKKILAFIFCFFLLLHIGGIFSYAFFKRFWILINPYITFFILLASLWIVERACRHDLASNELIIFLSILVLFLFLYLKPIFLYKKIFLPESGVAFYKAKLLCFFNLSILLLVVAGGVLIHYQKKNQASYKEIFSSINAGRYSTDTPNIIIIIMDTVRADHLSLYGYEKKTTPQLESFAQRATIYTNAISPSDMTLTATASLFTGMYPSRHGAHNDAPHFPWGRPLDDNVTTIAESLVKKGYITAAVSANHLYISRAFHLDQGFVYFDNRMGIPFFRINEHSLNLRTNLIALLKKAISIPPQLTVTHRLGYEITDNLFNVLNSLKQRNSPFFLFVNYMDAHDPYIPPEPFDRLFSDSAPKNLSQDAFMQYVKDVNSLKRSVSVVERRSFISQYDGAIAFIDFCLGKLFAYLKDQNLFENTFIVITSDHGEAFGEKNLFGHGVSVYQNLIHIPLIIKYPYQQNSMVCGEVVSLTDILPTIFDILKLPLPREVDGISLVKQDKKRSQPIISESFPWGILLEWHGRFDRIERAYFNFPLKLVYSTKEKKELYNISQDPFEDHIINGDNESIANRFVEQLLFFIDNMISTKPTTKFSNHQIERLKGLGYLK